MDHSTRIGAGLHRLMLILLFSSGVQPLAAIAQPLGRISLTGSMAVGRSGHTVHRTPEWEGPDRRRKSC